MGNMRVGNSSKKETDKKNNARPAAQAKAKIQPKLIMGQPNDPYEREADSVADRVVNNEPIISGIASDRAKPMQAGVMRKVQPARWRPGLQKRQDEELQAKAGQGSIQTVSSDVSAQIAQSKENGRPLPPATRQQMESGIGADFSKVRIHTDNRANDLSAKLNAQAFTVGNNVFFNKGRYNPETKSGKHLLAHELTHTVQQKAADRLQRQEEDEEMPENLDEAINAAFETLSEDIMEAQARKDYDTFTFLSRVELILISREYQTVAQFDAFFNKAHDMATSEVDTLIHLGQQSLRDYPHAYPKTWSDMFYDAMYLEGFDMGELQANAQESMEELMAVAERVPPYFFDHGLPVSYDELKKLRKFQLDFAHARMKQDHVVKDYMQAGFDFVGHGWIYNFVSTWNKLVLDTADEIEAGKVIVDPQDYDQFIAKHKDRVETMANRFRSTWDAVTIEEAQDDETNLKEASLAIMFISGLGSLAGVMYQWQTTFELFDNKKLQTFPMLVGLENQKRVIKAMEWAYELGYFGEAGDHIWQSIKQHGWQIIGMVMLMIGALVASHIFPPLGIALDIILLIWAGISVAHSLYDLVQAVQALHQISSVEDMQRKSGKLAQSIVGDGLTIILELAGLLVALKMSSRIRAVKADNPGLSTEAAFVKAMEDGAESGALIAKTKSAQQWLETVGNRKAARSALAEAKGDLPYAKVLLTGLKKLESKSAMRLYEIHKGDPRKILEKIRKADLDGDEIRTLESALAKTQAQEALLPAEASAMAQILKRVGLQKQLIFSGVNDIDLIWGSQRYWGMTEGAVYGARMPVNTFWERMKAMVQAKEGLVVFQGQAAALFNAHKVTGPYSGMKRLLGQHKAGFGDVVFDQATKHGNTIIVTRAHIDPKHAGRWHRAPDNIGSNTFWAGARFAGRLLLIEPMSAAAIVGVGLEVFMSFETVLED